MLVDTTQDKIDVLMRYMNDRIVDPGIGGADASSGARDYEKEPAARGATPTRPCECAHDRNLHQGIAADDGAAE
jgi:hypothetical protein